MGHLAVIVSEGGDGTAGEGGIARRDEGRVEAVEGLGRSINVREDEGDGSRGRRRMIDASFIMRNQIGH